MNISAIGNQTWKVMVASSPLMLALLYFAWTASAWFALIPLALSITALAVIATREAGERSALIAEKAVIADLESQVKAISDAQAVVQFDMDGVILDANENFLSVMGYSLDEIVGSHHRIFVDDKFAASAEYKELWQRLNRGEHVSREFRRISKSGEEVWIQGTYNPILGEDGTPVKVVNYATDITETKHLATNHEGQIAAIGRSQAIIEFDLDGIVLDANDNFLTALGYSLDEIVGQHHRLFLEAGEAGSSEYQEFWRKLKRGEYVSGEFKRVAKSGTEIWIQASYNPVCDTNGQPVRVVKIATDITGAKLEAADYQGQIEAIGKAQAVIEFAMDGTILRANNNFLDVVGYTLEEVSGEHHRMFVSEDERTSSDYRMFWEKLNRGEYVARQFKRITKDGGEIWIQASYNPILDMNGTPFKVVKFATDITAEKVRSAEYEGQIRAIRRAQAVIEFDMNGTILDANENFLKTVGYSIDEIVGKHHRLFVTQDHAASPEYRALWEKLNRGEYDSGQYSRLNKSGEEVWLQAAYNVITDIEGRPFKVIKFASDITEERRLANENAIIRKSLENVTSSVMVADQNNDIMYLNATALELFNGAEDEVRQDLPNFRAGKMLGSSIDNFHKEPGHQRRMLSDMRSTFIANITLGGRKFALAANPLWEGDTRLGTVLEWTDKTQEISIEKEVEAVVQSALQGDLTQRIDTQGKTGFIEVLSQGVNQLVGISERVIDDTVRVMSAVAQGQLTQTIDSDYEGSFNDLKVGANTTVAKLTEVVRDIQVSAGSVKSGADEISQGNTDLSQRTEEQASSLEETASSMEEMTSTVRQNADNAAQANQLAQAARDQAEKGGSVVNDAVTAMAEINSSSKKISDIIGVIDEIAFQTNLLALNASVEAARAGDQGRGFAVVASEVRNLAGRSATAAKEIKDLIEDSGAKVDEGSRLVNESGETLEVIVQGVKKVTDIVGEIAAASQEQAAGIDEVNKAITQMDELTQQNAALVEEAAAASESLGEQADSLNGMMQFFTLDNDANGSSVSSSNSSASVERRSSHRPWSGAPQARAREATAATSETAAPAPALKAASGGGDAEWEEF